MLKVFAFAAVMLGSIFFVAVETRSADFSDADQACIDAMKQVQDGYAVGVDKPLSPLAYALVRKCNGDPAKEVCEAASQVVSDKFERTPFNCGSDEAASVPTILPHE